MSDSLWGPVGICSSGLGRKDERQRIDNPLHKLWFQGLERSRELEKGTQALKQTSSGGIKTNCWPHALPASNFSHVSGACSRSHSWLHLIKWEMGRNMGGGGAGLNTYHQHPDSLQKKVLYSFPQRETLKVRKGWAPSLVQLWFSEL